MRFDSTRREARRAGRALVVTITMTFAAMACAPPEPPTISDGHVAPPFRTESAAGTRIDYPADYEGKPTIVFVWSTWCPYCKVLFPRLSAIQADFYDHGLEVIAINAKERGQGDPVEFMRESGYDFVTVVDGDAIAEQWEVDYLPGLFVVDENGTIVFRRKWTELPAGHEVADLWESQVREALKRVVNGEASSG